MKIKYSPYSLDNLQEIGDYIATELHNKTAAARILREIREKVSLLSQFPELGTKVDAFGGLFCNKRFLVVEKYIVVYEITADAIFIDFVVDSRMDYVTKLKGIIV